MEDNYILVGEHRDGEHTIAKGSKKAVELSLKVMKDRFAEYTIGKVVKQETLID